MNRIINTLNISSCNLTGTLDISGFTNLCDNLYLYGNTNLTNVIMPSTQRSFINVNIYSCNLGYVDFTVCPNLTSTKGMGVLLQNNNMTAAEVNHILVDLDTISTSGYTGRVINISGTNAAPDGTSGGYDGLTAKTSLQSKGFTVTTS